MNDENNKTLSFCDLGLSDNIAQRLNKIGIYEPTNIQKNVIPLLCKNQSLIFESETGTGKTFAYILPLVQSLEGSENPKKSVRLIIIAPTFELSHQIKEETQKITSLKCAIFIGGSSLKRQFETLKEKPQIVIGTPSRLLELVNLKKLKLNECSICVLDEADRLYTKEIFEETTALMNFLPTNTQIVACSATITKNVEKSLKKINPTIEKIILAKEEVLSKKITHIAIFSEKRDKIDTLRSLLYAEKPKKALIFTSRADQAENIYEKLLYKKIDCECLHSKTKNQERKTSLERFKSGKCPILITSDLASRGLDIPCITHIIQMDLPSDPDFFIHRAGRTARAGKTGVNIVIGDEYEMKKYATFEKRFRLVVHPKMLYKGELVDIRE